MITGTDLLEPPKPTLGRVVQGQVARPCWPGPAVQRIVEEMPGQSLGFEKMTHISASAAISATSGQWQAAKCAHFTSSQCSCWSGKPTLKTWKDLACEVRLCLEPCLCLCLSQCCSHLKLPAHSNCLGHNSVFIVPPTGLTVAVALAGAAVYTGLASVNSQHCGTGDKKTAGSWSCTRVTPRLVYRGTE